MSLHSSEMLLQLLRLMFKTVHHMIRLSPLLLLVLRRLHHDPGKPVEVVVEPDHFLRVARLEIPEVVAQRRPAAADVAELSAVRY